MTGLPLPEETAALVERLERQAARAHGVREEEEDASAGTEDRSPSTPGSIEPPD